MSLVRPYDAFMRCSSKPLAHRFADAAGVGLGRTAIGVGCGPGALTGVLVERLGAGAVAACDPSAQFVAGCTAQHVGVRVETGRAESIPFETSGFDRVMAQLVLRFGSEPDRATSQWIRALGSDNLTGW